MAAKAESGPWVRTKARRRKVTGLTGIEQLLEGTGCAEFCGVRIVGG